MPRITLEDLGIYPKISKQQANNQMLQAIDQYIRGQQIFGVRQDIDRLSKLADKYAVTDKANPNKPRIKSQYDLNNVNRRLALEQDVANRTGSITGKIGNELSYFVPGLGEARFAADMIDATAKGNAGGAFGNLAAMLALNPVMKAAGKGVMKLANKGLDYLEKTTALDLNRELRRSIKNTIPTNTFIPSVEHERIKLGDVEIGDKNIAYRMGNNITDDFVKTGKVEAKNNFLTKTFDIPMFKQGNLWYTSPLEGGTYLDLLTTREPLKVGTKTAKADKNFTDIAGTTDVQTFGLNGGRRIPIDENQLGLDNTRAYTWKDGYGYELQYPNNKSIINVNDIKSNIENTKHRITLEDLFTLNQKEPIYENALPTHTEEAATTSTFGKKEYTAQENKEFLNKVNTYFYNYPKIEVPEERLGDTEYVEQLVKDRIAEHNTFLRGVTDPLTTPGKEKIGLDTNRKLLELGELPTKENRMKYAVTRFSGPTGSGRAGFITDDPNIGVQYTSNSLETGSGYGSTRGTQAPIGGVAILRRPYTLGPDREKWLSEGDFAMTSHQSTYLSGGKNTADYKEMEDVLTHDDRQRYINRINEAFKNTVKREFKAISKSEYMDRYYEEIANKNKVRSVTARRSIEKTIKDNGISPNLFSINDESGSPYLSVFYNKLQGNLTDVLLKKYNKFYSNGKKGEMPKLTDSDFKYAMKLSKLTGQEKRSIAYKQHKEIQEYAFYLLKLNNYDRYKHLIKVAENKAKQNIKDNPINIVIDNLKGKPYVAFTTEGYKTDNIPYQHYNFTGPIDEKALDFLGWLPKREWGHVSGASRMHVGTGLSGYSRKGFKLGGRI